MTQNTSPPPLQPEWFSLGYCFGFMLKKKRILGWSLLLFLATIGLTTAGYQLSVEHVDTFAGSFLMDPPSADTIWGWIKFQGWKVGRVLFFIITRIMAFYLAFLVAYCLTSPGYVFLSTAVEKIHAGMNFAGDSGFSVTGMLVDIFEGVKIALFGVLVTLIALIVNFIPGLGQGVIFLLYAFYSALMFIDYPSSRRRWSLGRKIGWIRNNAGTSLRIGILPACISMIPLLNVFLMSLLFPLLTVYSTLNFSSIELFNDKRVTPGSR